jgi:GT2 family glycosyltransferase
LINDNSTPNETEVLKTIEGVEYHSNHGEAGFIHSVNWGMKKTDSKYVLILNSDTEANDSHCIEHMAQNLDDGAKVCGALLLYPPNDPYGRADRVQHAGVGFEIGSIPYHIFAGRSPHAPAVNTRRSLNAVTGACFMVERDWWNRLNGFSKDFGMGVYEDVDFCWRTKRLGGEVIYEPGSMWRHHEHASQEPGNNWFSGDNIRKNLQVLIQKHGDIPCDDKIFYKGVQ